MAVKKLTLSAPADVIEKAKAIASENNTSVSAMFVTFLKGVSTDTGGALPPITRKAAGLIELPSGATKATLLGDALEERYGKSE